jgi:nitroimidazol reductase NimA-like FMN-containing flavoprotein (pyridoxamine 5'-phosphate oxidase superfamily)
MLRTLQGGVPVCVTVTLLDGLVLARSAFHHSVNYRSVVILGTAVEIADPAECVEALRTFVEHVLPGRWDEVRRPSESELRATLVLKVPIAEASAKVRSGPPIDDEEDYALPCWAGVLPLAVTAGAPVPDDRLAAGVQPPAGSAS